MKTSEIKSFVLKKCLLSRQKYSFSFVTVLTLLLLQCACFLKATASVQTPANIDQSQNLSREAAKSKVPNFKIPFYLIFMIENALKNPQNVCLSFGSLRRCQMTVSEAEQRCFTLPAHLQCYICRSRFVDGAQVVVNKCSKEMRLQDRSLQNAHFQCFFRQQNPISNRCCFKFSQMPIYRESFQISLKNDKDAAFSALKTNLKLFLNDPTARRTNDLSFGQMLLQFESSVRHSIECRCKHCTDIKELLTNSTYIPSSEDFLCCFAAQISNLSKATWRLFNEVYETAEKRLSFFQYGIISKELVYAHHFVCLEEVVNYLFGPVHNDTKESLCGRFSVLLSAHHFVIDAQTYVEFLTKAKKFCEKLFSECENISNPEGSEQILFEYHRFMLVFLFVSDEREYYFFSELGQFYTLNFAKLKPAVVKKIFMEYRCNLSTKRADLIKDLLLKAKRQEIFYDLLIYSPSFVRFLPENRQVLASRIQTISMSEQFLYDSQTALERKSIAHTIYVCCFVNSNDSLMLVKSLNSLMLVNEIVDRMTAANDFNLYFTIMGYLPVRFRPDFNRVLFGKSCFEFIRAVKSILIKREGH